VERWRGWRGQRTGRRARRRAFRRIARGRGARAKSGVRRQGQGSRSRAEGRWGWQEAGWAPEGWASKGWASEGWARRGVGQQPPPWPVAGEGAPRREVGGKVVAFQGFLERAAEVHLWAPNRPWVRYPTGE
jgi:hypothetical protein